MEFAVGIGRCRKETVFFIPEAYLRPPSRSWQTDVDEVLEDLWPCLRRRGCAASSRACASCRDRRGPSIRWRRIVPESHRREFFAAVDDSDVVQARKPPRRVIALAIDAVDPPGELMSSLEAFFEETVSPLPLRSSRADRRAAGPGGLEVEVGNSIVGWDLSVWCWNCSKSRSQRFSLAILDRPG